jgi:hypothetical protein
MTTQPGKTNPDDDDDMSSLWRAYHEHDKQRKEANLAKANPDGWNKHTQYHWSRMLNGKRLDYWPSRNKFQYDGRVMVGDVEGFIRKRTKTN